MRSDGHDKIFGSAKYSADIVIPGMLYGKVVRSRVPHARIISFDTTAASQIPGVKAIITGHDTPRKLFGYALKDQNILAGEKIRFVGEAIAAVAAETLEIAERAADLVRVEYQSLPAVFSPEDALREGAPLIHERVAEYQGVVSERSGNRVFNCAIRRGDVAEAFSSAYLVVEDEFYGHVAHPTQLEPHASITRLASDGSLEVWTATQVPFFIRQQLADVLDLPIERVRLFATHCGGGFGNKLVMCLEPICALLTLKSGAPVRIVMTREEEFESTITRHGIRTSLRTAVDRFGYMTARQARLVLDKGAYTDHGPSSASISTFQAVGPYRIENLDVEASCVYTNKVPSGAYRGPTGPQVNFAVESHTDHVAARFGLDPIEFRLRNALHDGDYSPAGQQLQGVGLQQTIEQARKASDWKIKNRPPDTGLIKRGIGVACGWWLTGGGTTTARVRVCPDGKIQVEAGMEIGTGAFTGGVTAIVADELDIAPHLVEYVRPDTATTTYDAGSFASRSLFVCGAAAKLACEKLLKLIKHTAAATMAVNEETIDVSSGIARSSTGKEVTWAKLATAAQAQRVHLEAEATYEIRFDPSQLKGSTLVSHVYPAWLAPSFFTAIAEIEVDTETGRIQATRLLHAQDTGQVFDTVGVVGQIRGGVTQALGYALSEELVIEDGVVRNPNLLDYRVPTPLDVPRIEHQIFESIAPDGLLGSKGVGEAPIIAISSAIANAFFDATGIRPKRLPLSPENVFWLLTKGEH